MKFVFVQSLDPGVAQLCSKSTVAVVLAPCCPFLIFFSFAVAESSAENFHVIGNSSPGGNLARSRCEIGGDWMKEGVVHGTFLLACVVGAIWGSSVLRGNVISRCCISRSGRKHAVRGAISSEECFELCLDDFPPKR